MRLILTSTSGCQKTWDLNNALAYGAETHLSAAEGAKILVEAAKYYGVIRTLNDCGETTRLGAAYELLLAVDPPTEDNFVKKVIGFSESLQRRYGRQPLSAASKFLWIRFRDPVIIFDSIANKWLHNNTSYKNDSYENYCKFWNEEYLRFKPQIQEACADLGSVKEFTLASNVPDSDLSAWISKDWFWQRVFDHYMLINA